MTEALIVSRWIYFASVFGLFGASFFWFYMGLWPATGLPGSLRATILELRVAAPLAAISGLAWLAAVIANMTGGFENVVDPAILKIFFLQTQFGPVAAFRLALFAGIVLLALAPHRDRLWFLAMLVGGALLLGSQAWFGHATDGGAGLYGAEMILVYAVHMLAGASWVGGLPPLLFCLIELHRAKDGGRAVVLLSRYSLMGVCAVTLVIVTGVVNVAFHAGSPAKLLHSGYGEVLFLKLSLLAGMLIVAYLNRFVALPRLRAHSDTAQLAVLRASVGFEIALATLVIGAAAVLGVTPPPR